VAEKFKLYVVRAGERVTPEVAKIVGLPEGAVAGVNVVAFAIEGGVITPQELAEVEEETRHLAGLIDTSKPVIVSGRGPQWVYAVLAHNLHYVAALAVWEPRLRVGVVASGRDEGKGVDLSGNIADVELGGDGRPTLAVAEAQDKAILHFEVVGGKFIEPSSMATLSYPDVPSDKLLVVEGPMPVWAVAMLVAKYAHKVPAIAVYDPRLKGGVVAVTHTEKFKVGDVVEVKPEEIQAASKVRSTIVIGVLGDPNSGKSVFLHLLNEELRKRGVLTLTQEADLTAPTQEWSLHAEDVRRELKKLMNPEERLAWVIESLRGAKESRSVDVVLADIGGGRPGQRLTRENLAILRHVDGVIIVSRNEEGQLLAWVEELKKYAPDMQVYGMLASRLHGASTAKAGVGVIAGLTREAYREGRIPEDTRAVVAEIAARILAGRHYVAGKIDVEKLREALEEMEGGREERRPEAVSA